MTGHDAGAMVIDDTAKMIYAMAERPDINSWLRTLAAIRALVQA